MNTPANQVAQQQPPFTFIDHKRELHVYRLHEAELDGLASGGNFRVLWTSVASASIGVFAGFISTVITTGKALPEPELIGFWVAVGVSGIMFIVGALGAITTWIKAKRSLNRIKGRKK